MRSRAAALALALLAILGLCNDTPAREADPKVPAGRDPGGLAVALIGAGLDYRRPEVALRLARDGEGEPVGWDFIDDDARPFAVPGDGQIADIIMEEGPATRLVVARTEPGRQEQIAAALRFVAGTPARIVLVTSDPGNPLSVNDLSEAARHLGHLVLVVPARRTTGYAGDPGSGRAGLLIVAAEAGPGEADLAASLSPRSASAHGALASGAHPEDVAAARVAALAARVLQSKPGLSGAEARAIILSFAKQRAGAMPVITDIEHIPWMK